MFCASEGFGLSLFKSKRKESKPVDLDGHLRHSAVVICHICGFTQPSIDKVQQNMTAKFMLTKQFPPFLFAIFGF